MAKENISTISDYIYCLSNLIFFIILIVSYTQLNGSNYGYMHSIGQNWNNGPLVSIDQQGVCGSGEIPVITDEWPGVNAGCYCSFSLDFYGPLRNGRCNSRRDNLLTCSSVPAIKPIKYSEWKGKKFCGARVPMTYLDMTIATTANSCPFNSRSCGIIDSLNNHMCVPTGTPCPINEMKFINDGTSVPTDKNYTVIQLKGTKMLTSNENLSGKLYNEFVISDGQPCADPDYKNLINPTYKLNPFNGKEKCQGKIGQLQYDDRYQAIDSYNSYNILQENNILPLTVNLPLYPNQAANQHQANLYARNYIGLHPACLQELRANGNVKQMILDLVNVSINLDYTLDLSLAAMIIGIIIFVFTIIYFVMMMIGRNKPYEETSTIKIIFSVLPFILCIVNIVLCSICLSYLSIYSFNNSILSKQTCVDEITYAATNNFSSGVSTAHTMHGLSIAICVINFVLFILQCVLKCCIA